ncbi:MULTISPECIES: Crp/Fnr family transcriptional regulator [Bacillus]|uniref:Crp/Fnr family transcriptional regulator n=1 Tax=Bacillus TaxID=1386 RepID=UPI0018DEDC01|nr:MULTISPECIES: Crp/Fnr family transcriptional regulator [Bacillus]
MLTCIGAYTVSFSKGDYISLSGESLRCIGLVVTGTVHMLKEDIWGSKAIYMIIHEKEVFGETFICSSHFSATVSFYAATDCKILFMPFKKVMYTCSRACTFHHQLIENMVTLIANKNVQLMEKMEIMSKRTLREKILTYLSQQALINGSTYIVSPMSRLEMADYFCVNRSALTRELSNMKLEGLLDYDKNTFRLLKPL